MPVPIVHRPKLALWLFERDLDYRAGAELFGTTHETLRRCCLPFSSQKRRVPQSSLMSRIVQGTEGELQPGDFYDPRDMQAAA